MIAMQAEGKIRHIALSNVNATQLKEALGRTPIVAVQNMYNVNGGLGAMAQAAHAAVDAPEAVLDLCTQHGIAYLPFFPLAIGQISGTDSSQSAIAELAKRHEATPAQVALAWLLARSPVMLPIPGTGSLAHLEENWAARKLKLSQKELAAVSKG